jgi:hypothetical protein
MKRMLATIVCIATSTARADTPPWANGVTDERKAEARRQLEAGNALFVEHRYADALAAYRGAVAAWDHPAIRFNIVRCEIQLDDPLAAADDLALALKYGAAPLEDSVYTEALSYQKLLASQLAEIELVCEQPGVEVTLDGEKLAACPHREVRRVRAANHQLVAVKPTFLTISRSVVALGGNRERIKIELVPLARAARVTRRWATWKPWLVFGGGLATAALGGGLQLKASSDMATYDRQVTLQCGGRCQPGQVDDGLRRTAIVENRAAIAVIAVGAAATAVGTMLLYINRTHTEYPTVEPVPRGAVVSIGGAF